MLEINPFLNEIEVSVIRKIAEACKGKEDIINLTIGEPDLEHPKAIVDGTIEFMRENKLGYPPLGGLPKLRDEIAKFYKDKYSVDVKADEVIITSGSTEGLATAIRTVVLPGDEVIAPLPVYPGYEPLITLAGAKMIKVDTSENEYELTVDILEKIVTKKTKALILNYPCNPSGVCISEKNRDEILEFAKEKGLYIISDEVYSEILFKGKHNSFLKNEYRDNVILVNGFSKSHSLTGWRVGYTISSKNLRDSMIKVHQYTVTSACIISQEAGILALTQCQDISKNVDIYKERAKKLYKKFKENDVKSIKPKGAIYIFVAIPKELGLNSLDFCYKLLNEKNVAVVPGEAFGMDNFIRISLVKDVEILLEAADRMIDFIKKR